MLNIDSLETGIVIDHIKAGASMRVYKLLKLDKLDCCVAVSYTHLTGYALCLCVGNGSFLFADSR